MANEKPFDIRDGRIRGTRTRHSNTCRSSISVRRSSRYGCGHSTLFWAGRAERVVSVEHNRSWYELVKPKLPADRCTLMYEAESTAYANTIEQFPGGFDVIVIDGLVTGRTRLKCAHAALTHLKPGGMIILDNSDWLPESSRTLREAG